MGFKKYKTAKYPRRQWSIVGYADSGKSTFASRMQTPNVVVDADHRFYEVAHLADGDVYPLDESVGRGNVDAVLIVDKLAKDMDKSIRTITIDSFTPIVAALVTRAMIDNDAGVNKNRASAFKEKAMAVRLLQDGVTQFGADTLWIYHYMDGGDSRGKTIQKTSITSLELAKLQRSLNMNLEVVQEGDKRGIRVLWSRSGRSGMTIWDEAGKFENMPELIEAAVYDGLSAEDMEEIRNAVPTRFADPSKAIAWGMTRENAGFKVELHCKNSYEKLKNEHKPDSAQTMWDLWIAYVLRREANNELENENLDSVDAESPLTEEMTEE